ncbi:MAG: hypothetical protein WC564_02675 [Patescibacteria group bacterium]
MIDKKIKVFERIYVPPYNKDKDKIKKLVKEALNNGFDCPGCLGKTQNDKIEELTKNKVYFLVLEKLENSLTITPKHQNKVLPHLGNDDVIVYSSERAIDWIKKQKIKK